MGRGALSRAFYRQPAFLPHRLLARLGISNFVLSNAIVTGACVAGLTFAAWMDNSLRLYERGYGYLEHPGIFGWYCVQLLMPVAIFGLVRQAAKNQPRYKRILNRGVKFDFRKEIFDQTVAFIGLATPTSRAYFSFIFCIWFSGFAWNTYQNLLPNIVIPLDFWDSIHFIYGYIGTRIYKFYTHALLAPSLIHIFSVIIWFNISALRRLMARKEIHLVPFSADRCGGIGFVSDLILTPVMTAALISGLAFFGTAYTHKHVDVSTIQGTAAAASIVFGFYVLPTLFIRTTIKRLKLEEIERLHGAQERYYEGIATNSLHGDELREAHEYLKYFDEVVHKIDNIPNWPHLVKVFSVLGIALTPSLISNAINIVGMISRLQLAPTPN
jgi:hypothetical protein